MFAYKHFLSALLLLGASTTVLADGQAIADSVVGIQNATTELGSTVASWDGNILGAIPITIQSASLLSAINDGTKTAQASANLADLEAITVGLAVITLVTDVNSTITTLIDAKPKFDKNLLTAVVLLNLELEKGASDKFSDALLEKLPSSFTSTGEQLASEISASFDQAINVFSNGIL